MLNEFANWLTFTFQLDMFPAKRRLVTAISEHIRDLGVVTTNKIRVALIVIVVKHFIHHTECLNSSCYLVIYGL